MARARIINNIFDRGLRRRSWQNHARALAKKNNV